ncbi:MAG: Uma2 family endonuclease [Myxacorys chilensis ATA2-1-KO14]|jgi:Uma2 family endonuclease|nr:Uma2 family endonuclease [Myxacorys chilensis ATA2-1-KO14]
MSLTAKEFADLLPDATHLESDEPEMESSVHYAQLTLLVACLEFLWQDRSDFFIGANLTVYFSRQQLRNREFRGPDFFLVKPTERRHRNSWVVWEEDGKYPNIIIELLSPTTEDTDRTLKKLLYQDRFRTPEYFWFSPTTLEFVGLRLDGHEYQEIPLNEKGWRWSEELQLFLGVKNNQLRYFGGDGSLVPTPDESANQARQRAEEERQRADRLAERLRSLGINPDDIA